MLAIWLRSVSRNRLVVTDVEVGLGPVVGHEDLAVLERVHRPRIDVQVGVELLHGHLQAARAQQRPRLEAVSPFRERRQRLRRRRCAWWAPGFTELHPIRETAPPHPTPRKRSPVPASWRIRARTTVARPRSVSASSTLASLADRLERSSARLPPGRLVSPSPATTTPAEVFTSLVSSPGQDVGVGVVAEQHEHPGALAGLVVHGGDQLARGEASTHRVRVGVGGSSASAVVAAATPSSCPARTYVGARGRPIPGAAASPAGCPVSRPGSARWGRAATRGRRTSSATAPPAAATSRGQRAPRRPRRRRAS